MQKLLSYLREFKLAGVASSLEERILYAKLNKLSYQEFLELLCEDVRDTVKCTRENN